MKERSVKVDVKRVKPQVVEPKTKTGFKNTLYPIFGIVTNINFSPIFNEEETTPKCPPSNSIPTLF